ncbi:DUF4197 domain-containing protein [Croceicoccus naphthovorans]|uniref:Uncharacterized protein n=1 Tax=Croceicoccus naphthovorans TaxID=1348774 RepID=A0A0G3XHR1_9SPHN|nr:DUF4197 domain-containing protein [Croceicoccus naphthovorans]AKM10139.1 hypothetical protein AB433_09390 [Croceicoccus naphthovorans]MBB3991568.1 hypothetical protein [Croceicoccus naphthovorans]
MNFETPAESSITDTVSSRRRFLGFAGIGAAALTLPGCASYGGFSFVEAIRRLLTLSSERAFDRLLATNGFYDSQVARLQLDQFLGARGSVLSSILTSGLVKDRLYRGLSDVAVKGAMRAAPAIADTIRVVGISNAIDIVRGGPTAATGFLRQNMGQRLIDVMLPEIGDALDLVSDPVIGTALSALTGTNLQNVVYGLTDAAEETIWTEMGNEESGIRANPGQTNDPLLIGVFGVA